MTYRIGWAPAAKRALARIPEKAATAVVELAFGALAENPQQVGKPLHFELEGRHCARRGDYRIAYRIDDDQRVVWIETIEHRSDVYRRR